MAEKIKKYSIVAFLTFLIWAAAYNELERTVTRLVTLDISKNPNSNIYVTFDPPAPVEMEINFKGTPEKINNLINRIDAGQEDLKFLFNPENKKIPSPYTLDVLDFLHDSSKIRKLELSVESAETLNETIQVKVENLEKRTLKIRCLDENRAEINATSIDPSTVEIFVRKGFTGDASVILSERDVTAAQKDYVIKIPFVELEANDIRQGVAVKIKLPPIELDDRPFKTTRIGYSLGKTIMGEYDIKLENESSLTDTIQLKATEEAHDAYKNMEPHIFVIALDGDESTDGTIIRKVIYNFPPKYFAEGQIKLASEEPRKAKFKLVRSGVQGPVQ